MPLPPQADPAEAVIEMARGCAITSPDIRRLASTIRETPSVSAIIDRALDGAEADVAVALMLAAAVAGFPPTATQAGRILATTDRIDTIPVLVGCVTGDRVAMLLDLLDGGRLSTQREGLVLFLAVELLGDRAPPPELIGHLRRIGRGVFEPELRVVVGLAASGIDDTGVRTVLREAMAEAATPIGATIAEKLRRLLHGPVTDVLPAAAAPKVVSGFTVRRPVARLGRNEPCPCGSGRKYKHCCWQKDEARRRDPSPVAGLTMAEYRARAGEFMSPTEFGQLRPQEMLSLDLDTLPTRHLLRMKEKMLEFRYWDEAERVTNVAIARADLQGDPDEWREELIHEALIADQWDLVQRQVAALRQPANLGHVVKLALSFRDPATDRAGVMEQAAEEMLLRSDDLVGIELAFALLRYFPALGILVTRSIVGPDHPLDSETLLDDVEEARDRLQLAPGDPAVDWYDLRCDRHYESLTDETHEKELSAEKERLLDEVAQLRRRASEATARSVSLERALRDATRRADELDRQTTQRLRPAAGPPERSGQVEASALRQQIVDLQALIGEGNDERANLRRELSRLGERVREARAAQRAAPDPEPEPDDGLELALDGATRARPLVPAFLEGAEDALRDVPERVARAALMLTGRLAAGEQGAWSGVKALRLAEGVLSSRVGAEYRLLFRVDADSGRLVVSELILRRDLEKAIARHMGM